MYIWCKLKLTGRPSCFVVEIVLVEGVLETTFKVTIFMKICICKIQDQSVINPLHYAPTWGVKIIQKYDVTLNRNCSANKRSTVKIVDIFRICRAC